MTEIKCQNCGQTLGQKDDQNVTVSYKPYEVEMIFQELDKDHVLHTIQCPKCGCLLQIKS